MTMVPMTPKGKSIEQTRHTMWQLISGPFYGIDNSHDWRLQTAKFWTSSWVQGMVSKSFAPNLFNKVKRKHITVQKALQDSRWISHITPILSIDELQEYVQLWEAVQQIQLDTNRDDKIIWRWTTDGEYTSKGAYHIQFEGSYTKLRIMPIWKTKAEPKCRFFVWTQLHKKVLTINNLIKNKLAKWPPVQTMWSPSRKSNTSVQGLPFHKQVWAVVKN